MNNELGQIVKVLSDIKKELHIHNIITAMQYIHPNGVLYAGRKGVDDFFEKLLKGIEKDET